MKKLVLSAILLAAATFSYAQVMVNGVDINKLDIQYIEIYAASGLGGCADQLRAGHDQHHDLFRSLYRPQG
ncbi:MAG: hypothetical protein IPJ00_07185 [Saprospirales bacterium]|nr:hypothetical protein [Saprospirales bacterium]